jgi:hypothetical protein
MPSRYLTWSRHATVEIEDTESGPFEQYAKDSLHRLSCALLLFTKQLLRVCHVIFTAAKRSDEGTETRINPIGTEVVQLEDEAVNANAWKHWWPRSSTNPATQAQVVHNLNVIARTRGSEITAPNTEEAISDDLHTHSRRIILSTVLPVPGFGATIPNPGGTIYASNAAPKS